MTKFSDQYRRDNEQIVASDALIKKTIIKMKGETMKNNTVQKKNYLLRVAVALLIVGGIAGLGIWSSQNQGQNNLATVDKVANITSDPKEVSGVEAVEVADATDATGTINNGTQKVEKSQSNNWFDFSVSAAEPSKETKQLAITQGQSENVGFVMTSETKNDGTIRLLNAIDFDFDGENITKVELSVDQGYFGYFYFVEAANPKDDISEFVKYGKTYVVSQTEPGRSEQLYWAMDITNGLSEPKSVNIKATATFTNGESREQSLVYNLGNHSLKVKE